MSDQPSVPQDVSTVAKLLKGSRTAFLTTSDLDGRPISRPMAVQQVDFDGDLWFFAERTSRKFEQLARNPLVNVTVATDSSWVSLTGTGMLVVDPARKADLWNAVVEAWFPDGKDDADVVLLHVTGESAEYWDTPGGRIASLVSFAKAKVTGQPYSGGENETVEL